MPVDLIARVGRATVSYLVLISLITLAGCDSSGPSRTSTVSRPMASRPALSHPPPTATVRDPAPTRAATTTAGHAAGPKPVLTPQGMWWGVDSTAPIDDASLTDVRGWYRGGHRPQFWGRYLGGSYAVSRKELAFARAHHIYVYLVVPDDNCSGCSGGDACGNDVTVAQARTNALNAAREARKLGLPGDAVLYKDIEEVSSCYDEPSTAYLLTWYRTLRGRGYQTGFYGNVHRQFFEFPRAYCSASSASAPFRSDVLLAMNEDEPLIGAPRGSTGPGNAPKFAPKRPGCAPEHSTTIWQYGEPLDSGNWTDIDQARPDTPGMLAPDGSVTG